MRKIAQLISGNKESPENVERAIESDRRKARDTGRGMALLVDYGADHFFPHSLRVSQAIVSQFVSLQVSRVSETIG
jgi:hypothetical protein